MRHRSLAIILFQLASSAVSFQTLGSKQAAATGRGRRPMSPMPKLFQRKLKKNEVDCTTSSEDEWDESCFENADEYDSEASEYESEASDNAEYDSENEGVYEAYISSSEVADISSIDQAAESSNSSKAGLIVPSVFAALALIVGAALIVTRLRRNQQDEGHGGNAATDFIEIRCIPHDYPCGPASSLA
mmetsp:Transcript_968/g.2272  ORF Transcript_968/g.2272 Transcript_968/m.2272 type:complete len:188 (-) Transcript_968:10-573(-)